MILKVVLFSLVLGAMYFAFQKFSGVTQPLEDPAVADVADLESYGLDSIYYLPTSTSGEIVRHKYFALSYREDFELAEWVAYELTSNRLFTKWVDRTNNFRSDPLVKTKSATPEDYRGSHLDRGHLAPAGDMAFSKKAMSQSFFMSNIAPQVSSFNKGVWRELEELTRDWAKHFKHLYVVTGPVLTQGVKFRIGDNQVAVAPAFYKVLLDLREPELKAIAFVVPNETTDERIETFATSVDAVEELTGIDFFPNLMPPELEAQLESSFDLKRWKTNDKKYRLRVRKWNKY
jgi:endonuclease G, mitochondrial